jgi:hypothetical protein
MAYALGQYPTTYTINSLFQKINFIANKYHIGQALTPEEFTNLLVSTSDEHFSNEVNRMEAMAMQNSSVIFSKDILKGLEPFVTRKDSWTVANGILTLPKKFAKLMHVETTYGSPSKLLDVEYVGAALGAKLRQNPGIRDLTKAPFCVREGSYLRFFPKNLTSVNLVYLRKPWIPYYYYSVNTTYDTNEYAATEVKSYGSVKCTAAGSAGVHTVTLNHYHNEANPTVDLTTTIIATVTTTGTVVGDLITALATAINNGDSGFTAVTSTVTLANDTLTVTAPAGWGTTYNDVTCTISDATGNVITFAGGTAGSVQLEWDIQEWHKIEAIILAKVGINQRDADLVNFAMANEAKDDNVEKQIMPGR